MYQSNISYRTNRFVSESKKNYASSSHPTAFEQKQIEELQQKVDMILMHNNQLIQQNLELKHKLEMANLREVDARYSFGNQAEQAFRLRKQLQLKNLELEEMKGNSILERQKILSQFDQLNYLLKQMQTNQQKTLSDKKMIEEKYERSLRQHQLELQNVRQQLENEIYENSLKKEIQHKEQIRQREHQFNKLMEKKLKELEQYKLSLEQSKLNAILAIQEQYEKKIEAQRIKIQDEFQEKSLQLQRITDDKCRKLREQSEMYIKTVIQNHKDELQAQPLELLKQQIKNLKNSLSERQKVIENLLNHHKITPSEKNYYSEVQQLRKTIKDLTTGFFKQTEILKVKMAVKHDIDVRETIKVYDNKIDMLASHIKILQDDRNRLRQKYQDQIRSKIKQRHKFQIEVSKLKNYIRKMKIELQSYGKQMRLNIEGIRDQANSFSMSILGEIGQQRSKKVFYEQEMRKIREVIQIKDKQIQSITKQCDDKILYYEDKIKSLKQLAQNLSQQIDEKEESFKQQIDSLNQHYKGQLEKQRKYNDEITEISRKQKLDLQKTNEKLQQNLKETESKKSSLEKDIQELNRSLESCRSHIEELKMQLEIAHEDSHKQYRNSIKQHYERIVSELQKDKQILKQNYDIQSEQMNKLLRKYQILQKSIQKTLSTMKKKTELQDKVVELGSDGNLVKNLAQLFSKDQSRFPKVNKDGKQNK